MIRINLLSEGKKAVRAARTPSAGATIAGQDIGTILLVVGFLAGVAAGGINLLMVHNEIKEKDRQIAVAQREADELAAILEEVADYEAKKTSLENKITTINELKANQTGPVRIMDEISRALPQLLWLSSLEMKGNVIVVRGEAFNTNAVANFSENLDKVPEFQEPVLQDLTLRQDLYGFTVQFNFAPKAVAGLEESPAATG